MTEVRGRKLTTNCPLLPADWPKRSFGSSQSKIGRSLPFAVCRRARPSAGLHARVLEHNERGVGVCLVWHFNRQAPTELQLRSLRALARHLMDRYGILPQNVLGHRECPGAATECPGDGFPIAKLRESLR